jgi:ubiquinone/menaquinone biosynthesis C-methylase UbiE
VTIASLQQEEVVLDLGSGGGIDCFLAARQVGETGYVIGVDMTPEMLAKANANKEKMGVRNVEFRQGQIEALPVADNRVDVVISNCVINLSPDKPAVFREAFRVLKPGGRISVSDIVTEGEFSEALRAQVDQWAACVTGAIDADLYVGMMREAGFVGVQIVDKVDAETLVPEEVIDRVGAQFVARLKESLPRIFSARITARKPV